MNSLRKRGIVCLRRHLKTATKVKPLVVSVLQFNTESIRTPAAALPTTTSKRQTTFMKKEIDAIQEANPTHILLVQVGMFYEIYDCGNYLDEIAGLLGIRIGVHKRIADEGHCYHRFAGFPIVSLRTFLDVLVTNGRTVAIVNQIKPHPTSNVIHRQIVRIVTPGTLLDDCDLKLMDNNFLLSIYMTPGKRNIGLAWLDISTGEFNLSVSNASQLASDLARIQPKEIIIPKDGIESIQQYLIDCKALLTSKPDSYFISEEALIKVSQVVVSNDPSKALMANSPGQILKSLKPLQIEAAGALLSYIAENFPSSEPSIRAPLEVYVDDVMKLEPSTIEALELVKIQRDQSRKGSLLSIVDKTKTAAGHRLLSSRLKAPSTVAAEIRRRLGLVNVFYNDILVTATISDMLSKCKDVERSLQRIHCREGGPSDLSNVIQTLDQSDQIQTVLRLKLELVADEEEKNGLAKCLEEMGDFRQINSELSGLINEDSLTTNRMNSIGIIKEGVSIELDQQRKLYQALLDQQDERANDLSSMMKMKCVLGFDSRAGPVVEIGKSSEKTFDRIEGIVKKNIHLDTLGLKQTASGTKMKDEIWTDLYKHIQEKIDILTTMEAEIFIGACRKVQNETLAIILMCKSLAELDISSSIATLALSNGYVKPSIVNEYDTNLMRRKCHDVIAGRHPVVEAYQLQRGNSFVVNDSNLNQIDKIWLLTGPNMGGKSTFLRQTALISIMCQTGLFVPCASAQLSIVDQIFSRIGSSDDLSANRSTFMVEMMETASILKNATSKSLIIMDEVGRGTSTKDGLALGLAILKYISDTNQSLCIFATHYHELAPMIETQKMEGIAFYQALSTQDSMNKLTCLYKILPGVMDRSHGIQIAELAGLPTSVILDANRTFKELE